MQVALYYDGECPFCQRYAKLQQLQEAVGQVQLVDLRHTLDAVERIRSLGFDPDKGMIVESEGRFYTGADALHWLALHTTGNNGWNRLLNRLFQSKMLSGVTYPLLRAGRNLVLLALDRTPIESSSAVEQSRFELFSAFWGLFALLHYLVYAFQFAGPIYLSTWLTPVLGVLLLLNPGSRRLFLTLLGVMVGDAWLHMPVFSNHSMIKNVIVLAMLASGLWHGLRGGTWREFFDDFAVIGRCVLLTMYVFGVFHKINTGFLDPAVSCAVVLWREMPAPLNLMDASWVHMLTIWGTLIGETAILVMLLVPRWRHPGILLGMAFHMLLSLSNYAMYAPFSMLSVVMHSLFLSPAASCQITQSPLWQRVSRELRAWRGCLLFAAWVAVLYALASLHQYSSVSIVWLFVMVPMWWTVAKYGRDTEADRTAGTSLLWSPRHALNLLSVAFFLNCLTPYLGLKTAQSVNMFANLRLEGGVSNHLVLPWRPGPFGYLEDIVSIEASSGSAKLSYFQQEGLYAVYYDLLDTLDRTPGTTVTFVRNGIRHANQTAHSLRTDMDSILHPRWVRNWFHFTPVDSRTPKPCALNR